MVETEVYTRNPTLWSCECCNEIVETEPNDLGNMIVYSPISRYWRSLTHPSKTVAVFCGVDCATRE